VPARPRGHGDGGDADVPRRPDGGARGSTPGSVSAAQEAIAGRAQESRPGRGDTRRAAPAGEGDPPVRLGSVDPAAARAFVDNVVGDPRTVAGRSAEDIADQFTAAGYRATVQQSTKKGTSGNAVQVRIEGHPEITNIQVHPGGGRHTPEGSPYWKISTSTTGKTWVIPGDFRGAGDLVGNVVRYDE